MRKRILKSLLYFSVFGLVVGPIVFMSFFFVVFLGGPSTYSVLQWLFVAFEVATFSIGCVWFFYSSTWRARLMVMDLYYTCSLLPVVFLICAGLGGMSQAVVEGVAGPAHLRYLGYAAGTAVFLVVAQVVIFPWVALNIFILRFFNRKFSESYC